MTPADIPPAATQVAARARIPALDIARTGALLAMVIFHFTFDLELFGYLAPGTTTLPGPWRALAVATASAFLFLAGMSLWMAHGSGIRWPAFWWRFGKVGVAALLVTIGTYMAFPDAFVFFGILHSIALCSLLGLAALRLPALLIVPLAAAVFFAPDFARSDAFNAPWLWWTGLQTLPLRTVDYEPIFPWFSAFLLGMALAKAMDKAGLWARLSDPAPSRAMRLLSFPGQHSLIIYLIHQPILIGLVWAVTQVIR
ncbi:heparan-alpha-glucosaminide N-acetyltransferase [Gymnodinialimonas hymeniacidonis]|uniref:heparan-alpha-glucosaminide N-acetyltransferase n=1 Tax=Gymnodinialimonas hymeniacidonis TaxID=3126508 RepID=UPI0034C65AA3